MKCVNERIKIVIEHKSVTGFHNVDTLEVASENYTFLNDGKLLKGAEKHGCLGQEEETSICYL